MEQIRVHHSTARIEATEFNLEGSEFTKGTLRNSHLKNIMLSGTVIDDVNGSDMKIINANLSDLEIEGAQIGGAFIHNIGMPPKGHPFYNPNPRQRPVRFENCNLHGSTITNCNLENLVIDDCNVTGVKINGILLEDLLKAYSK